MPRVSVVVPTWNGAALLPIALDSLRAQRFGDFEVVVVDNGSTDGTAQLVRDAYPEARLITLPRNEGFAAAVNAGIAAAGAPFVALLNNDAEVAPGWLEALVRAMDAHADAGAAASRVLQRRDPSRIDSAGDTFGVLAYSVGHGDLDGPRYQRARWVASACAAAALYRRSALEEVGPLDERFFAYLEDVDLGLRLLLAGWRTRYVPDAVALHEGSATADRLGDFKLRLLLMNSLRLFIRYAPPGRLVLFGPLLPAWVMIRATREARPWIGFRTLAAGLLELPRSLAVRRRVWRGRRISRGDYAALLASPFARWSPGHPPGPDPDRMVEP